METKVKLLMSFKDEDGKSVNLGVDSPRVDLTEVEKNIFAPNGLSIVTAVEVRIVETNTINHDLII